MKTVLVVGSGAREHALAWKLSQSPQVGRVIVAPGNPGMLVRSKSVFQDSPVSQLARILELWPVSLADGKSEFERLAKRCRGLPGGVDLAVIGPDNPLADGIVDVFEQAGIPTFGPTARAAQIEASKAFAKEVMRAAGLPTAQYRLVSSVEEAQTVLSEKNKFAGRVVKADGLAFGKGVRVCDSEAETLDAVRDLLKISKTLVIEEKLFGKELSWMALCDGKRCALLEPARDYKRRGEGDQGPNTGGMGAFSPVPGLSSNLAERVRREVFLPTLAELSKRGAEFRGLLYAGLMVDHENDRYWVLEFNARFGDPETQVILPRIEGDLYPWLEAVARGDLSQLTQEMSLDVPFKKESAVYVVAAAPGYPDSPTTGQKILFDGGSLRGDLDTAQVFFAGVKERNNGELATAGGRVLGALGLGADLEQAREQAYHHLSRVSFDGMGFRKDIGKAL